VLVEHVCRRCVAWVIGNELRPNLEVYLLRLLLLHIHKNPEKKQKCKNLLMKCGLIELIWREEGPEQIEFYKNF
jgi:hypothetical protein